MLVNRLIDYTGWQMFDAIWQPYLISLGASIINIGMISAVYSALLAGLQFFTGAFSDAFGRKKSLTLTYILGFTAIIGSILTPSYRWIFPLIIIFALIDAFVDTSIIPLMAESSPPKKHGSVFSVLSLSWFLPGFFAPALGGIIANRYGFRAVLFLVFILEVISFVVFHIFVKEPSIEREKLDLGVVWRKTKDSFLPEPELYSFIGVVVLNRLAYAVFDGVLYAMIISEYGYGLITIGLAVNVFTFTTAITLPFAGRIVDKYGSNAPKISSNIFYVFTLVLYLYSGNVWALYAAQLLKGVSVALWDPAFFSEVNLLSSDENRGQIVGQVNALRGILTFPAPLIGAFLFQELGFPAPVALSLFGVLGSTLLALKNKSPNA
jgi:DHA1 family multidrug resistance protein-like MFS transporter